MLDAAITIPVFIVVLFFIIDAARMSYLAVSLQDSLHRTARWAITGDIREDGEGEQMSRFNSLRQVLIEEAGARGITISPEEIFVCPIEVADCSCPVGGCADGEPDWNDPESEDDEVLGSGRLFKISARTRLTVPLTLFTLDIQRTAIGRNESF